MALLSKSDILGADDLETRDIEVPEWGGTVRVRGLDGRGRDSFELKMARANKNGTTQDTDFRASMIVSCIIDEAGKRLFTDKEVSQLAQKSGAALDRVFEAVRELSGIGEPAKDADVEDFEEAAGDDSPSV